MLHIRLAFNHYRRRCTTRCWKGPPKQNTQKASAILLIPGSWTDCPAIGAKREQHLEGPRKGQVSSGHCAACFVTKTERAKYKKAREKDGTRLAVPSPEHEKQKGNMAFIYYLKYTTAGIHVNNTTLQVLTCFAPSFLVGFAVRATLFLPSLLCSTSHMTWSMQVRYPEHT